MSDMFTASLIKSLIGGGKSYATQDQPWNPAAGLYNGGGGLLGGQMQMQPMILLGNPRQKSPVDPQQNQPVVAPGGDTSNPNPDYFPNQNPQQQERPSMFGRTMRGAGAAIMPQTMGSMGKGGGV